MAELNFAHRELTARVIFFGPAGAGCSSNVRALARLLPDCEAESFAVPGGGTDERVIEAVSTRPPLGGPLGGPGAEVAPRVHAQLEAWALPGGLHQAEWRRAVFAEADALVFVADARADRARANVDAMLELERLLEEDGRSLSNFSACFQVNHGDGDDVREPARVVFDLNPYGLPVLTANAKTGQGVLETWQTISEIALRHAADTLAGRPSPTRVVAWHHPVRRDLNSRLLATRAAALPDLWTESERRTAWRDLPLGPEHVVSFQPADFAGSRPQAILDAQVDADGLRVELVMTRANGESPRRLSLRLENRPSDAPESTRAVRAATAYDDAPPLHASVPASLERALTPEFDLPPVWYGVVGLVGGVLIGLLGGFLLA